MTKKLFVIDRTKNPDAVKVPVEKVTCLSDGSLATVFLQNGKSYDGYCFVQGRTDLELVLE